MKHIIKFLFLFTILSLPFAACKRDLVNTTLKSPSGVSGFTASTSQVTLSSATDSVDVVSFQWQTPNYGFSAALTYSLYFDVPSDTSGASPWGNAIKVSIATDSLSLTYLGTDFNNLANRLGLTDGTPGAIVVRVASDVSQSNGTTSTVQTVYGSLGITVTPYHQFIVYPQLYVAGDFETNTWTPVDSPGQVLASVGSNSGYEGYVNFPNANNNFKLLTQTNWSANYYGWGTSATTLGLNASGNCWTPGPAYMQVKADVSALTISYTTTNWVVSGDFNSWSVTANPMTFNATTNQWTATNVNLTAGTGIKFVGDPSWNTFYGVDANDNLVQSSQTSISITKTGTYTVTLDLSHGAGNYTYSIK